MPPRYFTPRPAAEPPPPPGPVVHPLDVFTLERAQHTGEWVVGLDGLGALTAQPLDGPAPPSSRLAAQLAYHEVGGGSRRRLPLEELSLFELRLVEQAPDSPGVDDPVYLYGTMVGPLVPGGSLAAVEGQLTVTRGDLLEAAVEGAPHAFRFGGTPGDPFHSGAARAFHLHLAGDRAEEIEQGRGSVLVYPVLSADLRATSPGNELFFDQLLYDLIAALWSDVERESPPPVRRPSELPVPDRDDHEQRLVARGFAIEGDTAVRRRKGLLGAVLGSLIEDRRPLPPEGRSDQYVELAREALTAVPGWPTPRVRALRTRARPFARAVTVPTVSMPMPPPPPPPPPRRSDAGAGVPAWMEDFIGGHASPGRRPPQLTTGRPRPEMPPRPDQDADVENDEQKASGKPDWMKDFEP